MNIVNMFNVVTIDGENDTLNSRNSNECNHEANLMFPEGIIMFFSDKKIVRYDFRFIFSLVMY